MNQQVVDHGALISVRTNLDSALFQYLNAANALIPDGYLLSPLRESAASSAGTADIVAVVAGKSLVRAPFIIRCPLFRRDFEISDIEIVGAGKLPSAAYVNSARIPSEGVNYETGEGPWRITDLKSTYLLTWLSAKHAKIPYFYSCFPGELVLFSNNLEESPEWKINMRSVEFGKRNGATGLKPRKVHNPVFEQPPYPAIQKRQVRLNVGDIIEFPTIRGLAYVQVTPYTYTIHGSLFRAFDGYFKDRPAEINAQNLSTKFLVCCHNMTEALRLGYIHKLGKADLIDDNGKRPVIRSYLGIDNGFYTWVLKDDKGQPHLVRLDRNHMSMSMTDGHPIEGVFEYFDLDWRPESDLWTQVSVVENEKRLAASGREGSELA